MNETSSVATQDPVTENQAPRWPIYLGLTTTSGMSACFSLLAAALSINAVVIYLSIITSVLCFAFALTLASHRRDGFAFLVSLATAPVFFGLTALYQTTTSFRQESVQKATEIKRLVVDTIKSPQPALDQAIREGAIRKATAEDVKAFRDAYLEKKYISKSHPVPATENALSVDRVDLTRAYVVMGTFIYPAGLLDEYRAVFFVPTGIPQPRGDIGHSATYDFASLTVSCTLARTGAVSC